jgi:hypothetical protein
VAAGRAGGLVLDNTRVQQGWQRVQQVLLEEHQARLEGLDQRGGGWEQTTEQPERAQRRIEHGGHSDAHHSAAGRQRVRVAARRRKKEREIEVLPDEAKQTMWSEPASVERLDAPLEAMGERSDMVVKAALLRQLKGRLAPTPRTPERPHRHPLSDRLPHTQISDAESLHHTQISDAERLPEGRPNAEQNQFPVSRQHSATTQRSATGHSSRQDFWLQKQVLTHMTVVSSSACHSGYDLVCGHELHRSISACVGPIGLA